MGFRYPRFLEDPLAGISASGVGCMRVFVVLVCQEPRTWKAYKADAVLVMAPTAVPAAKSCLVEHIESLAHAGSIVLDVTDAGPVKALARLRKDFEEGVVSLADWRKKARTAAVMGSCPRSRSSHNSGVRNWREFVELTHGKEGADEIAFPPHLGDVLAWSNLFRRAAFLLGIVVSRVVISAVAGA